jgi:hypothetical protein
MRQSLLEFVREIDRDPGSGTVILARVKDSVIVTLCNAM